MTEVIGVKFRTAGKVYYFSPKGVSFSRGEYAIVETSRVRSKPRVRAGSL